MKNYYTDERNHTAIYLLTVYDTYQYISFYYVDLFV